MFKTKFKEQPRTFKNCMNGLESIPKWIVASIERKIITKEYSKSNMLRKSLNCAFEKNKY